MCILLVCVYAVPSRFRTVLVHVHTQPVAPGVPAPVGAYDDSFVSSYFSSHSFSSSSSSSSSSSPSSSSAVMSSFYFSRCLTDSHADSPLHHNFLITERSRKSWSVYRLSLGYMYIFYFCFWIFGAGRERPFWDIGFSLIGWRWYRGIDFNNGEGGFG